MYILLVPNHSQIRYPIFTLKAIETEEEKKKSLSYLIGWSIQNQKSMEYNTFHISNIFIFFLTNTFLRLTIILYDIRVDVKAKWWNL